MKDEVSKILSQSKVGWLLMLLVTILLGFRSKYGYLKLDVQEVAGTIFQVSGTMVALMLPTAHLAYQFFTQYSEKFLKIIENAKEEEINSKETIADPVEKAQQINDIKIKKAGQINKDVAELRKNFYPSLKAIFYVFCSFLLSAFTLILPNKIIPMKCLAVDLVVDYFFLGASLSSLVIGSFYFIPTALYIFKFKLLDSIQENHGKVN